MAIDKKNDASPIDTTAAGAISVGLVAMQVPAAEVAKVTAATQAATADPGAWFRNVANTVIRALGVKEGVNTKEPAKGSANSNDQTSLAGVPERQALSTDTAAKAAGPKSMQTALLPILTFLRNGAMFFVNNGGLTQLLGLAGSAALTLGTAVSGSLGKTSADITAALAAAAAANGKTLDDLKTDKGLAEALKTFVVPPTPGVNNTAMPLGDYLGYAANQFPVVGVPARQPAASGAGSSATSTSTKEVAPGVYQQTSKTTETRPSSPPQNTNLVPPNLSAPPKVDLVSTLPFRHDPNMLKTYGNPAAAIENEIALAQDLNAVAGAQAALAGATSDISNAADKFVKKQYDQSLALSLRALIKGLVTYNFQADADLNPTTIVPRALRWWDEYLPPPSVLDPTIIAKLANGQTLSPAETTAYNTAMTQLTTLTADAASDDRRFPSLPGTLVYAALKEDPYPGTLNDLIGEVPERVALKEGLSPTVASVIHGLIYDLDNDDTRVNEIPDLLMGADPRIQQYAPAIKRWIKTVESFRAMTPAEVAVLQTYVSETGSGPLTFVDDARAMTLSTAGLYDKLLHDRLLLSERLELGTLVSYWDALVVTIDPDVPTNLDARAFLHELVAAKQLLGLQTLAFGISELGEAVQIVGGMLGPELAYAAGVVGALLRADVILTDNGFDTAVKASRTKVLLTEGEAMSKQVTHFPNPGLLKNIAEVL